MNAMVPITFDPGTREAYDFYRQLTTISSYRLLSPAHLIDEAAEIRGTAGLLKKTEKCGRRR